MSPVPLASRLLSLLLAGLLTAVPTGRAAPFAGEIGDGTALFLPDGLNPDHLPPSLALVEPPTIRAPLPDGWALRPEFSMTTDGKTRVTLTFPTGTSLYGEGEVTGPLLRNNTDTILWNTDNDYRLTTYRAKRIGKQVVVNVAATEGKLQRPPYKTAIVVALPGLQTPESGLEGTPTKIEVADERLADDPTPFRPFDDTYTP